MVTQASKMRQRRKNFFVRAIDVFNAGHLLTTAGSLTSTQFGGATFGVHHFDTPDPPDPPNFYSARLLQCNCRDLNKTCSYNSYPSYPANHQDTRSSDLAVAASTQTSGIRSIPSSVNAHFPRETPQPPSYFGIPNLQNYVYQDPRTIQSHQPLPNGLRYSPYTEATHIQSRDSTPVNTTRGIYPTEALAVFISNLPFRFDKSELENHLNSLGKLVHLEIRPNKKKQGYSQGTANARFATRSEAENARRQLNGLYWKDRCILARFDKETTVSGAISEGEPMIVNGSGRSYSS